MIVQRPLGVGGPAVGAIGLGCMGFVSVYTAGSDAADDPVAVIRAALAMGVTLIDTADVYGPYTSEDLVGRALSGRRHDAVVATKVGMVAGAPGELPTVDCRPERIREGVDGSLRRLGVEAIGLYQLHRVDPDVPLEESWGAMGETVAAGKVRAIGLSEASAEQLAQAAAIHPVASVQSELSLWTRDPLRNGVLDWCAENGAAFIPYAPLGRGFLTGALTATSFPSDDYRSRNPRFTPEAMAANRRIVEATKAVARRHGATPAQVAIAWALAQGDHVIPIPGTKRIARLTENAAAADLALTARDLAELDALPSPVGARY
jgi:aryl-alcohol dehydrogenase-like predicted oxidoreductase